jgi:putative transposon-encoded protein
MNIYLSIMVRTIKINKKGIKIEEEFEAMYEKTITQFGTGAKIDAPKEYLGKKVYVLIRKS